MKKANILVFVLAMMLAGHAIAQIGVLPSWNDVPAKKAIIQFVTKVTDSKSIEFVAPDDRIAVFDNDGTLWSEQPIYFQLQFALDRVKAMAKDHPEWSTKQPFQGVLENDMKAVLGSGEKGLVELVMATHSGMTTDQFQQIVKDWLEVAKHPRFQCRYTDLIYQPMLELLVYLRMNGFRTYIVSGGGVEFLRSFSRVVYGIPPELVIGSSGKTRFEMRDGKPVLLRLPEIDFINDKEGKPVGINQYIGRRPIAAFGNSDGDLQMLQWTTAGEGPRFALIVHHTDAEREWAYDRKSSIGHLDKALDEAQAKGWTVVSMKDDWNTIFPPKK